MENNNKILIDIAQDIGEIKGELKGMNSHLARINGRLDNHSKRINKNTNKVNVLKGQSFLLGGIAGFVISVVAIVIEYFKLR